MLTIEEIFCLVDDFCKDCIVNYNKKQLANCTAKRNRTSRLSHSEIITLLIDFQTSKFRDFKSYYIRYVSTQLKSAFPDLVSYNRFVELIPRVLPLLVALLQSRLEKPTGIAFIDSTELPVCHRKRIKRNKVFAGIANIGKSSKGWFLGFKLHLLVNHLGELLSVKITTGNVDDKAPVKDMAKYLKGKIYGDKGYISKKLSQELLDMGINLVTSIRKNMKPRIMSLFDKLVLKKRPMIESINNQLKNSFQIEHTRHRSPINAFSHIISALIAYCFNPNKPAANIDYHKLGLLEMPA